MRPADELYIGAWGEDAKGTQGFLVSEDPLTMRDAHTGMVSAVASFERLGSNPNTPHEIRKNSRGLLCGHGEVVVTAVNPDGTIEFTRVGGAKRYIGLYSSFSPLYASNH